MGGCPLPAARLSIQPRRPPSAVNGEGTRPYTENPKAWPIHNKAPRQSLTLLSVRTRPLLTGPRPPPLTWTFLAWGSVHPEQPSQVSEAPPPPPPSLLDARILVGASTAPPLADLAALAASDGLALVSLAPLPPRLPAARAVRLAAAPGGTRLAPPALRAALHGLLVQPGAGLLVGGVVRLTVESVDGDGQTTTPARVGRGTALLQPGDPDPPLRPPSPRPTTSDGRAGGRGGGQRRRRR